MGAEFTDPLKAWCCAAELKIDRQLTQGNNTIYQFEDSFHNNMDWIIKIQAAMRGKINRMRYYKKRDEFRKKQTHFKV